MEFFFLLVDVKDASSGKQFDPSSPEYFLWSLRKYTIIDHLLIQQLK